MDLTIQNVYGLLIRSRLLSLDDVKGMFARWNHEAKEAASNVAQFAKWMVANKYLTEYQASLLARGHADGLTGAFSSNGSWVSLPPNSKGLDFEAGAASR